MAREWARPIYNSARWQAARREVLRRDGYTCRVCGARAEEVHHVTELTPGNVGDDRIAYDPANLVALCRDCHQAETHGWGSTAEGFGFDEAGQLVEL